MKISIIVPVYNSEKFLEKLIDSIEMQTYKNYEVIFINDGSTDNSIEILNKRKITNEKILIISQENTGPGLARKNGYLSTKGDLLYFIDSDDYLPNENVLMDINNTFEKYNPDILFFDRNEKINGKEEIIKFFDNEKYEEGIYEIQNITSFLSHGGLGCKVFKKNMFKEDFFINSSNMEDYYTTYMYLDNIKTYYYLPKVLYTIYHEDDNCSLTTNINFKKYKMGLETVYKIDNNLKNRKLKSTFRMMYPLLFNNYILKNIKFELNKKEKKEIKPLIKKITNIIKKEKIKPKFSGKIRIIKKIVYNLFLKIY